MKYIDEYRQGSRVQNLVSAIHRDSLHPIRLMEVCGGHTMAIHKFGIQTLLPQTIELLSGPGCPVCVTGTTYIDQAIAYSHIPNTIITTFGDLIRVPGSITSLNKEKAQGKDIRIVYSPRDAVTIAKNNPDSRVIFLGIGFETTAPTVAAAILEASADNLTNFFVYSAHKIMPPAMSALIHEGIKIDGYICPGHVSAITGSHIYEPFAKDFKVACVISGFEPVDLLESIWLLIKQIESKQQKVEIQYSRAVKPEGNTKAKKIMETIFSPRDDEWRGLGIIPKSGLGLSANYDAFNAENVFTVKVKRATEPQGCECGNILKGLKTPRECMLFGKSCTPTKPIGACMVSTEGSCAAYFRYSNH